MNDPEKKYMDMAFDILDDADLYELQKAIAKKIQSTTTELEQQLSIYITKERSDCGKIEYLKQQLHIKEEKCHRAVLELEGRDKLLDECEAALLRFILAKASNGTWNGHKLKGIDKGNRILNIYQEDLDAANNVVIKLRDRKKEG